MTFARLQEKVEAAVLEDKTQKVEDAASEFYQTDNIETACYQNFVEVSNFTHDPALKYVYPCLGLAGETGEVIEHVKKIVRDGREPTFEDVTQLKLELGDVIWYVSRLSSDLGLTLSDVMTANVEKLSHRQKHGKIA